MMNSSAEILIKFEKLGFSSNESKVYLALIKIGSSKAGALAKYAGLDRSSTYNSLNLLLKKGLASYVVIGKTKWFQSSNPNNILSYLNRKVDLAKEVLPELESIRRETKLKENVRLFKGTKGVQTVFEDILHHASENLIFGSEGQFSKTMPAFAQRFMQQMKKRGIKVKSLVRSSRSDPADTKVLRHIPSTTESPVVTNIYGGKIAIVIWSEIPEAILIENQKAAEAYRDYFNFMWKSAEK